VTGAVAVRGRRFVATLLALAAGLLVAAANGAVAGPTDLPEDQGLPVIVRVAAAFVALEGFDENAATFTATVDLRLRWRDRRLAVPGRSPGEPSETLRDAAAEARLAGIWAPPVVLANQIGEPERTAVGLRVQADGGVELVRRVTATFKTGFDVERFPFDRQKLQVEAAVLSETASRVALRFDQEDIDYSRPARDVELLGWTVGRVDLKSAPLPGWYAATHARVVAALQVSREPGLVVSGIFVPLLASLLIPLLAIWLNRTEEGMLQVDSFELVNIIIGGLFAVIALNFTVYSSFAFLAAGENTVSRLFTLNYVALALALLTNILFGRFNVLARAFGPYVQEQAYLAVMWLLPVVVLVFSAAFILSAFV
jgi:hypothetical protein